MHRSKPLVVSQVRASPLHLVLAFAAVYVIWGSTYLAIRFAIETLPPFLMAGFRFLIAGTVMYGGLRIAGATRPTRREWVSAVALGTLLLTGGNGGVVWAEQRVPSGLAALMVATVPLWIVIIDWVRPRGSHPSPQVTAGLVAGFAGVTVLIGPAELMGSGNPVDPAGAVALILASLSWAFGSVLSRHTSGHRSPFVSTGMKMLAGGGCLLLVGTLNGEWATLNLGAASAKSLLAFGYLVVFGALVGFSAYVWLLKNAPLSKTATYAYVNPMIAVLLGWLLADEPLTPRVIVAAAIIVMSVVIITSESSVGPVRR